MAALPFNVAPLAAHADLRSGWQASVNSALNVAQRLTSAGSSYAQVR